MRYEDLQGPPPVVAPLEHAVGPATFRLRAPTPRDIELATFDARESGAQHTTALARTVLYVLVRRCLLGWSGVPLGVLNDPRVTDDQAAEPLTYSRAAVEPLLTAQPDWERSLADFLAERIVERADAARATEKN